MTMVLLQLAVLVLLAAAAVDAQVITTPGIAETTAGCAPTFGPPQANTHGRGGAHSGPGSASLDACKRACGSNEGCTALDWDPANPYGEKCWLIIGDKPTAYAANVTHYVINRDECKPRPPAADRCIWHDRDGGVLRVVSGNRLALSYKFYHALVFFKAPKCLVMEIEGAPENLTCGSYMTDDGSYMRAKYGNIVIEPKQDNDRFRWDASWVTEMDDGHMVVRSPMDPDYYLKVMGRMEEDPVGYMQSRKSYFTCGPAPSTTPVKDRCSYTWSRISGATSRVPMKPVMGTPGSCRQHCIATRNCIGVSMSSTRTCGLLMKDAPDTRLVPPHPMNPNMTGGVRHYDLWREGFPGQCNYPCKMRWQYLTSVPASDPPFRVHGPPKSMTAYKCRRGCAQMPGCAAVHYDDGRCTMIVRSANTSMSSFTGSEIWILTRINNDCGGSCGYTYAMMDGFVDNGATSAGTVANHAECRTICINMQEKCVGYEVRGTTCYISAKAMATSSDGSKHRDIYRSYCGYGCNYDWSINFDSAVNGGTDATASNEPECRMACAMNDDCKGATWTGSACKLAMDGDSINSGTAAGSSHFVLSRDTNCNVF